MQLSISKLQFDTVFVDTRLNISIVLLCDRESAEKLRSKMSLALGGLVDRALNKMLGSNKALSEPSTSQGYVQAESVYYLDSLVLKCTRPTRTC